MRQSIVVFLQKKKNNFIRSNNRSNKKGQFCVEKLSYTFSQDVIALQENGSSPDLADKCGLTFRLSVSLGFEQITIGWKVESDNNVLFSLLKSSRSNSKHTCLIPSIFDFSASSNTRENEDSWQFLGSHKNTRLNYTVIVSNFVVRCRCWQQPDVWLNLGLVYEEKITSLRVLSLIFSAAWWSVFWWLGQEAIIGKYFLRIAWLLFVGIWFVRCWSNDYVFFWKMVLAKEGSFFKKMIALPTQA